jgi:hypothetical protein
MLLFQLLKANLYYAQMGGMRTSEIQYFSRKT